MKKFLRITAVVCLVLTASVMLFACANKEGVETIIGKDKPTATATTAITASMDGTEMLMAAIDNYYGANYAASILSGKVDTTILSGIKVTQAVLGRKIRSGVFANDFADDSSTYFIDNRSYSAFAAVYEETLIKNNDIKYRSLKNAKKGITQSKTDIYDMQLSNKAEWKDIENYNDDMEEYVTEKSSDPRKIWAYNITPETIKEASTPTLDSNQYKFTITMDIEKATGEYKEVMLYQLETNSGMSVSGLNFTELEFEVVLWDNGFLAELRITESYEMKLAGIINSEVTLKSTQYFSYDATEKGFEISAFENQF